MNPHALDLRRARNRADAGCAVVRTGVVRVKIVRCDQFAGGWGSCVGRIGLADRMRSAGEGELGAHDPHPI